MNDPDYLSINEAAKLCKMSRGSIRDAIRRGFFKGVKLRTFRYMIPRAELERFVSLSHRDRVRLYRNNPHLVNKIDIQRLLAIGSTSLQRLLRKRNGKKPVLPEYICGWRRGAL